MTQAVATERERERADRVRETVRERERERELPCPHDGVSQNAGILMWYHTGYQVCGPQIGELANFYFDADVLVWCLFRRRIPLSAQAVPVH